MPSCSPAGILTQHQPPGTSVLWGRGIPKIWRPYLTKRVLYSEVLDKYFEIQVTLRTLDLIDEAYGLDHYILKTSEVDLNSQLAMQLKREMLLALVQKTLYPEDPVTREKVLKKYKQYLIPVSAVMETREITRKVPSPITCQIVLFST
ncbi:39S ribosomal protein L28, mitochondrial-like [Haliotis rubra]|uniref:39S ribosomal protein L28, mitochondrial-like n=1 Tax=Haliotis rubra TaxID=36100 RepID=UPI001EE5585E|nr:39S ribosomal protein L28, mitochondrial-like [Haliotis rubra]